MAVKTNSQVAIEVKNSPIHGKGLYAGEDIARETIIGRVSGRWTQQDSMYTLWIDEDQGFRVQCDFKYINHSGKPNVAYYDDLTVVALRKIRRGEELFHDYGWDDE